MPRQLADDPARIVVSKTPWLGSPGSFRWPWDWSYTTYKVIAMLVLPVFLLTWLVLPIGLYAAVGIRAGTRFALQRMPTLPAGRWWLPVAMAAVVLLNVGTGVLLPMPFWAAGLATPIAAAMIARRIDPYVDFNRPLRFWLSTLYAMTTGPRATRAVAEGETAAPAVAEDVALSRFHFAALTLPEDTMALRPFHPSVTVFADRWLPEDEQAAASTIYSLARRGIANRVLDNDVLELGDNLSADPGEWIVVQSKNEGGWYLQVFDHEHFQGSYVEASPVDVPTPARSGLLARSHDGRGGA